MASASILCCQSWPTRGSVAYCFAQFFCSFAPNLFLNMNSWSNSESLDDPLLLYLYCHGILARHHQSSMVFSLHWRPSPPACRQNVFTVIGWWPVTEWCRNYYYNYWNYYNYFDLLCSVASKCSALFGTCWAPVCGAPLSFYFGYARSLSCLIWRPWAALNWNTLSFKTFGSVAATAPTFCRGWNCVIELCTWTGSDQQSDSWSSFGLLGSKIARSWSSWAGSGPSFDYFEISNLAL